MKVIFLDIDGVLNSAESFQRGVHLEKKHSLLVRRLCKECDAKIVISSSWRNIYDWEVLLTLLESVELSRDLIVDITPQKLTSTRGDEIEMWLRKQTNIESYVILDDDSDMLDHQLENFVQTSFQTGLLESHFDEAKRILTQV